MKSLKAQIEAIAKKKMAEIDKASRATLIRLTGRIIQETPYATGRAKGNWLGAYGSADTSVYYDVSDDRQGSKAKSDVNEKLGSVSFGSEPFYFTNSLPYIQRLEYGWSAQKPNGMLRRTLQTFDKVYKEEFKRYVS